jgi:high-affinity iron transporter
MLATAIIVFREVTSSILSESSMLGLLHVLIGYPAQPAGIQVIFYLATLPGIGTLMRVMGRGPPSAPSRPAVAASI